MSGCSLTGFVGLTRLDRHGGKGRICWVPFRDLPFVPGRVFWVEDFLAIGGHATRRTDEAVFVLEGEVDILLDRPGHESMEARVSSRTPGFLIPAGWWRTITRVPESGNARVLVLASGEYDGNDQVPTREEFYRLYREPVHR